MLENTIIMSSLTVRDLQQSFGNNTAGDVESLAAVEAAVGALNIGNSQTAHLGDRETAEGLLRLRGEEETLEETEISESENHSPAIFALSCDLV